MKSMGLRILSGLMTAALCVSGVGMIQKKQVFAIQNEAEETLANGLHAKAAVLMDMDTGRVLFEKNGDEILPMASTTKIMTCILALEEGDCEAVVEASAYASAQPKVHLGMKEGMQYKMEDLLYSLMLESHNDTAVAIAEHIGGSLMQGLPEKEAEDATEKGGRTKEESKAAVKRFCERMTEKAREIGCYHTYFVTPNGLDEEMVDETGNKIVHSTTASDLARMMRYCISQSPMKENFIQITSTNEYTFTDLDNRRTYACTNHNALRSMMDGIISGKTGFTNGAGYCYVGAREKDEKRFVIALLACGWPGNKTWKWADSKKMFQYGDERYRYRDFVPQVSLPVYTVENGISQEKNPWQTAEATVKREQGDLQFSLLTEEGEQIAARITRKKKLFAPVKENEVIGKIEYFIINNKGEKFPLGEEKLLCEGAVEKENYTFFLQYLLDCFLLKKID